MIISYQWLLEYLPEPLPVEELSKILTSIGLEVEAIESAETIKGGLEGLVIGEVLICEKHPNADKLRITTVNIGSQEPLHIVCGAPNVAAGQKVVVAPVGTMVHPLEGEPFLIKKAKIRGEESAGMICAEDEIGLGKSHDGVIVLPDNALVGTLAKAYYNIGESDKAIHIGLTPNRSDAMSHIGVARDVCAYLTHHKGKKYEVKLPDVDKSYLAIHRGLVINPILYKENHNNSINIKIEIPDACPRYAGISIKGVKIGSSPEWLQQRLNTIGLRSINNVVDVTNYVLHEYGQPLHAFDADKINGNEIQVRFLNEGATFATLDEKERKLHGHDIMICDAKGAIAMGGVFGGLHSGVGEHTENIFIESAYFNPAYIRRTSLQHGLRTDAATHFEKGVDINNVLPALKRAAMIITGIAGGTIASDITDVYPVPIKAESIKVSYSYIHKLSGKPYAPAVIKEILPALGFVITNETEEGLTVTVPSNKTDVHQQADIVEEILRIDGLDNIEIPNRLNISLSGGLPNDIAIREKTDDLLRGGGFHEIVTNSITNSKYYPGNEELVHMLNSLSSELDIMRPSMLESGLEVIQYNCNRKSNDLCLFELGKTYALQTGKYIETQQLGIWITGNVQQAHWDMKATKASIFYLKGVLRNLLLQSGIESTQVSYDESGVDMAINWKWKNQLLCSAMQVNAKRLHEFDVKQEVFFASINWALWVQAAGNNKIKYKEVAKFPSVQRDLAIVLDKQVSYQQVQQVTDKLKLDTLRNFDLFDIFESEKLGAGKKSYALNYVFQLQDRTLTDAEIERDMKQLAEAYKTKLNAQIRE